MHNVMGNPLFEKFLIGEKTNPKESGQYLTDVGTLSFMKSNLIEQWMYRMPFVPKYWFSPVLVELNNIQKDIRQTFKVIFDKGIPERTHVIDENDFYPRYFIGLNGFLYENYGTEEKPVWETVFDANYEIEIIKKTYSIYCLKNSMSHGVYVCFEYKDN